MSEDSPIQDKLDAKEVTRRKMALKDILLKHDMNQFRMFLLKDASPLISEVDRLRYLKLPDDGLDELMHVIKSSQPYLGEEFQRSRNFFRMKQLAKDQARFTEELNHMAKKGTIPNCVSCHYFRTTENIGDRTCLQQGALPGDLACAGWRTIVKNPVTTAVDTAPQDVPPPAS